MTAPAAKHDLKAVAFGPFHQLPGDVDAASGFGLGRHGRIVLPIAIGAMRKGRCRRGVRNARCRDDAGGEAARFGQGEDRAGFFAFRRGAIVQGGVLGQANDVIAGFYAGEHRCGGWRGIRDLRVMRIGLDEAGKGQRVHGRGEGFAVDAGLLALENPRGGQRVDAHAVADKNDHIAGAPGIGLHGQPLLQGRRAALEIGIGLLGKVCGRRGRAGGR